MYISINPPYLFCLSVHCWRFERCVVQLGEFTTNYVCYTFTVGITYAVLV